MHFLFLSKVPVNELLQVPQQGPYGDNCPFTGPFLRISYIPHKNFPKQRNFRLLSKALGKERPSMYPKSGAPMETDAHFPEPYLAYPSGSPVKEPFLQVPRSLL